MPRVFVQTLSNNNEVKLQRDKQSTISLKNTNRNLREVSFYEKMADILLRLLLLSSIMFRRTIRTGMFPGVSISLLAAAALVTTRASNPATCEVPKDFKMPYRMLGKEKHLF